MSAGGKAGLPGDGPLILTAVALGRDDVTRRGRAAGAIRAEEGAVVLTENLRLSGARVCRRGRPVGSLLTATGFNQLLQFQGDPVPASVTGGGSQ